MIIIVIIMLFFFQDSYDPGSSKEDSFLNSSTGHSKSIFFIHDSNLLLFPFRKSQFAQCYISSKSITELVHHY